MIVTFIVAWADNRQPLAASLDLGGLFIVSRARSYKLLARETRLFSAAARALSI